MRIIVLAGERGAGKTTLLAAAAAAARTEGRRPGGLLQPGVFDPSDEKTGSTWLDAATGESGDFGSNRRELGGPRWKLWSFSADGLARANRAVLDALARGDDPVFVDEIGPLELRAGAGLLPALLELERRTGSARGARPGAGSAGPSVVVAVRADLAPELAARLGAELVELRAADRPPARRALGALLGLPGSFVTPPRA